MVDADVYFGDDFGQKIDLTVRIREILRNYPEGTSIFKEMVQNADDAGATEVNLCLDYRQHAATGLAYEKLASFQGPSLLVHNNATFSDADFQSIQRIGDSLKKDNSKGWKTGRFGVGFNSVYHVTDLPAFVSGSQLVFFDPQACHLPNVNPSNPGKMIDYIAHPDLVSNFPDQINPFRCFGCNFSEPFLISIWEWRAGEDAPTVLHKASISNMTSEIKSKRSLQHTSLSSNSQRATQQFSTDGIVCDYPLSIEARHRSTSSTEKYEYLIMNQLGGGECTKIACEPANASQRLVPWGGVAVSTTADSANTATSGLAFCFLPLPTHTYLPVHVNGYFELSSNRRDICEVGGGRWVSPTESMVIRSSYSNSKHLEQLLIDDDFPVVRNLADDLERVLVKTGTVPSYVEPQTVRKAYKTKSSGHAGNQDAIKCLLSFMLSDLESGRLNALVGVKFLPVADGTLRVFENRSNFDPNELEYLCSMGFTRQHAVFALAVAGGNGVETALNWLLQNPNPSIVNGEGINTTFYIPSREELELLEKARGHLVNIEAIGASELKLLSSEVAQKQLNVQKLDYQGFEDMLAVVLPAAWFGKLLVPWSGTDDGDELNEEWFRQLWNYIGKSKHLSSFKDKWPLVPTSSHKLAQLSASAGVLSAELIPEGCLQCLKKIQVRLLLPNLFASFQPNPEVWQYIHQPTPAGFRTIPQIEERGTQWVSSEEGIDNLDSGFSSVFVSLAEIKERHHEPLLCMGIATNFLDDNFVFVKEGDATLAEFLALLGVRRISKVEFFAKHLIPRFNRIKPEARVKFVYQLLVELNSLLAQDHDGILSSIIETAAIFPTMTGDLKCIDDLYDPEIDEFMDIMDESFFPALELQDPQPLSALRSIGLQRALSRRSILSLAVSIENDQMTIAAGSAELNDDADLDEMCEKLRSRSVKFFHVPTAEALEGQAMERAEIEDFKAKLAIIVWIPVCEEKPHPAAPWYKQGERVIVASSQQSRPTKQLWHCSSQFHIIKCSVHSEVLRGVLSWDKHVPVETIAAQLKKISLLFDSRRVQGDGDQKSGAANDTHVIWSAVYNIYQVLSVFFETEQGERRNQILTILSGNGKYVWVGDRFVSANHVANVAVVNAEPYLYTVPNELLHFRPFLRAIGVRERFALADYVHVLGSMYKECSAVATSEEGNTKAAPLSGDKLTTAIGLIQLISDTLQHHSDYELFAPDRNGVLEFAASLTYDDAPWLDERDYETSSESIRFIHPKISNEVAAKIGSRSLRNQLLNESGHEAMSSGDVEAFGQTEALTKRIAHILEQYPDGPNIISELIQNADDAGATRVAVLYNSGTYGTSSLLSPAMAKWQGPALYCYNDAEFSDGDFINLARIGQASKLQRAATTGRFGLGFNSVYHFTDLPSIVSAKSIEHHYKGTLFRFPLRDSSLAESSEIKRRGYSHREIVELFKSFQASIIDTLLFLRNVRKVEVYYQPEIDQPPVLLYDAEVPKEDRGESWREIDRFMRYNESPSSTSGTTELSAKREFYARLLSTPKEELPSVTQVLHIRRRQQKELQESFGRFGIATSQQESEVEIDDLMEESTEKYLVCNQIGGGKARDMACAAENESLKLIPWVGIASRIDGVPTEGRAFCFLPLPVRVGLPVHVNGYFELSSNRRDIWTGDDMSGDGKLRSEWNANLLVDAVAPAYLAFLLKAKAMSQENSSQYLPFFPTNLPASPWDSVVLELFRIMKNQPIFFASPSQAMSNTLVEAPRKSVAPSSCVLVDDSLSDWETLEAALDTVSLVTVHLPAALRNLLVQLNAVHGAMTPGFFRQLTRTGDFLPVLNQDGLKRVVQFCMSDCLGTSNLHAAQALNQLPLLPLKNGKFERLCFTDKNDDADSSRKQQLTFFFGNAIEEQLLGDFQHRVHVLAKVGVHIVDTSYAEFERSSSSLKPLSIPTRQAKFRGHFCCNNGDGAASTEGGVEEIFARLGVDEWTNTKILLEKRVFREVHQLHDPTWLCSSSMDILDGELTSEELIGAFKWNEQVDSFVIAKQLEAIGLQWEEHCRKKNAEASSSTSTSWRFPLSEVHLMYEELENYRLSDEEGWETSPVYRKLANALWIWTGKGFVYPCQIAVEADPALEPLLYSCPSEHIIPRSLLASFGLKNAFDTVDYLEAIMRLPRNVALNEKQVAACLKIYETIADDTPSLESALSSFVSQEMVLLDQSNRLVSAVQLTFDDMEWNESREVRRGATFVSNKIPKTVAGLLGAASLHSTLAQTSVTSRRVVCPPADALKSVLPLRSEWHHALLWETILAAERFGGTQVDFFLDSRHHSSQRVIQPSLQPLQDEALCIHIHDLVLSENDINNLFQGESSRAGLLCGFTVSDSIAIYHSSFLSEQRVARDAEYVDSIPLAQVCVSCVSFRTGREGSRQTGCILEVATVSDADFYGVRAPYFDLECGEGIRVAFHCHGEVYLDAPERTMRKRNITRQNQEWKKRFSLQSFFKTPQIPENQMELVVNLELENRQHRDTWLFADNIGWGRSRDLACTPVHEMLHSLPYVSVACHIFRDGNPAPRLRGHVYKIVDTQQKVGLPVHINGCFKKTIKDKHLVLTAPPNQAGREGNSGSANGSELQVAAGWNRILLEDGASDAYAKLLLVAKRRYESSFPTALYNIWPTLQKRGGDKELGSLVQTHTYHSVGTRELFLCTDGVFRGLSNGYQLDLGGMNIQVASFAQLHFPAFNIPARILQDCSRLLPSRIYAVTPRVMRRFLRSTLADNIERVLPPSWKNQAVVDWDPRSPVEIDQLWLYRFWQVVHYERRSLGYFANWPLIPAKGSRLVSCAKMDMAVCVWDGSADSEISAQVAEAFQASATEQERKMAGMEAERKRLMELSSAKLKKDDDLADESSDEEDSGEVDDGEDVANDSESVSASDDGSSGGDEIENTSSSSSQGGESNSSAGGLSESEDGSGEIPLSPGSLIVALENVSNYEDDADDLSGDISEGFAVPVYPVEDESPEFCSRETIHNVLLELNVSMMELAYLGVRSVISFHVLLNPARSSDAHSSAEVAVTSWQCRTGGSTQDIALFRDDESEDASYRPASAYCDPRNKVLATIYAGVRGQFPAQRYRTPEWLDLMGEIGLQTEVTVDIFVECAQRIDGQFSGKQALSPEDEHLITTLHEFFVQNFDKFDRSRSFFERITPLSFVPAVVYENVLQSSNGGAVDSKREGQFTSRSVVRKYSDCATPDDQALVYSTMPILANVALPTRVLYSRLGIKSPPPQDQVVRHLLSITNGDRAMSSRSLDWQFFLPMVEVFQAIFKFLQENWGELRAETQQRLANAAVIPVGSTLVKGSRLFFHLGENLAPLMFEVPRVFGAYDTLFRHMGSKEAPEVSDYIRLLRDLKEECCDHPLNLNELIAAARAIDLFVAAMVESNYRLSLERRTVSSFRRHEVLQDAGGAGITSIVTEELDGGENPTELLASDDIAHFNSVLASQQFADGLRKIITAQQQKASSYDAFGFIPDFEDLNQRIMNLATYEVKCVAELHSRFIAKLEFPARRIDVTKTERQSSLYFLDQTRRRIFITKRTLEAHSEMGMRASHLVARCINQLLGGVLQDCSVLESILTSRADRGKASWSAGQPLCEADCANVELAPLRSCLPGELIAVEDENGTLCYGKILREEPSGVAGCQCTHGGGAISERLVGCERLAVPPERDTGYERRGPNGRESSTATPSEVAEAGRRAAAAQIDTVIREKKEVQDSLVCAVCLENQVNRVLIPCGHIYCASCVQQLPRPSCPICRQNIVSSSVFHVPS
ncbi:Zinc finger, RING-type, conserved site [Phytophthora cactorum]|nr:Zinc finger, RING-type, conserved site [Phytophthora cactorum]